MFEMFERLEYSKLKEGEIYYVRISSCFGYKGIYVRTSMNMLVFKHVELYEFISKKREKMNTYSEEYCLFSRHDVYLRIVTREEYMNKLKEMHERFMTNKILQIIDENFKYY
jgi:hypothetical protein